VNLNLSLWSLGLVGEVVMSDELSVMSYHGRFVVEIILDLKSFVIQSFINFYHSNELKIEIFTISEE